MQLIKRYTQEQWIKECKKREIKNKDKPKPEFKPRTILRNKPIK